MTGSARVVATDNLPFARCMAAVSNNQALDASLPRVWTNVHNGDLVSQRTQEQPFAGGPPLNVAAMAKQHCQASASACLTTCRLRFSAMPRLSALHRRHYVNMTL